MPKLMETRLYSMADADLKQLADAFVTTMARDAADFATRNITTTHVNNLEALIDVFDDSTTDEEFAGMLVDATETKDALAEEVRVLVRPIRNMANIAYNGKGKYGTFGFDDLARLSTNDLPRMVRRVVRVGTKLIADLQAQGLTGTQLPELTAKGKALDDAIDIAAEAVENRDLETQDRILKGNALYKEIIRLASIGKSLYEDTNEAKFNDYVIVGSSNTPPPSPQG